MSRSFKKTPSCHMAGKDGYAKKAFSRRVRRLAKSNDLPDGGAYRKLNESWDISDWHDVHRDYESFRAFRIEIGKYVDEKQCKNEYEKYYRRK